ncbi:hypothetical protein BDN70DRAFT_995266 [Pholiota conissans]|uniref:MYND-type domain-containing protein n=1 Tax=Pholiota conissans TaxID=109636 RepID=A0A9P6CY64_9AGAR|nr:hypothetical protein BDN70DRAFT_995266 [Pholiota conissans]
MALIRNVTSLSNFFSNVEGSGFCARCILGASSKGMIHGQGGTNGSKTFWSNFTQDVGFWRSQMHFLFAVRTDEQTQQLLDYLNRCSCRIRDSRIREYHQIGRKTEEALLERTCVAEETQTPAIAFITDLFLNLVTVLESAHLKSIAKRTSTGHWPTCPEDLMPFGPEELVNSFIVWSRFIPDFVVFHAAALCAQFCGSILQPYITQPALTRCVVDAARRFFDRTWTAIVSRTPSRRRAMGKAFLHQIRTFLQYFSILFDPQPAERKMTMLDGYELKAIQVCSLLLYAAHDPRLLVTPREAATIRKGLAGQGSQFCFCIAVYIYPLPTVLLHPSIYKENQTVLPTAIEPPTEGTFEGLNEFSALTSDEQYPAFSEDELPEDDPEAAAALYASVAGMVVRHIRHVRFDMYCSARDCPNSIQSTGRSFQRCTACGVASYCNKLCQINSWKSEQFPHKNICRILKNLVSVAGSELLYKHPPGSTVTIRSMDELTMQVVEKWRQGEVPMSDLFTIAGWASHRMHSVSLPMRSEYEPGYEDYERKLPELSGRNRMLEAQPFILDPMATAQGYNSMINLFDQLSAGTTPMPLEP